MSMQLFGTMTKYFGSCNSIFNSSTRIIDSGASEHMYFDSNTFISLSPLACPININLPNSHKISVTHIGQVSIFPNLILKNVLHVPIFRYNLISVYKFSCQFAYTMLFTSLGCMLQGTLMKSPHSFGEAKEGLYLLQPSNLESSTV